METAASLVREGSAILARTDLPKGADDAEVLLAHLLGVDRAHLHAHPEEEVMPEVAGRFRDLVNRRASRVPLQYLTGEQEFWSLRFTVSPAVMIPRPETEGLIETFLRLNDRADPLILDVGTGSGCIAVAAAHAVPRARLHAVEIAPEALAVARVNAAAHGLTKRIEFHQGDLFAPLRLLGLEGRFDFVLSNPPYIDAAELATLEPEVRDHEPRAALTPGIDGLAFHRRLALEGPPFLKPGGHLIVEVGAGQAEAAAELYGAPGILEVLEVRPDLSGIPRALVARTSRAA